MDGGIFPPNLKTKLMLPVRGWRDIVFRQVTLLWLRIRIEVGVTFYQFVTMNPDSCSRVTHGIGGTRTAWSVPKHACWSFTGRRRKHPTVRSWRGAAVNDT